MPKGPRGEKRPSDVIGNAVKVMKIATGEIEEDTDESPPKDEAAADLGLVVVRRGQISLQRSGAQRLPRKQQRCVGCVVVCCSISSRTARPSYLAFAIRRSHVALPRIATVKST